MYPCPVYKYPMRQDRYLVTIINLRAEPQQEKPARGAQVQSKEQNAAVNNWTLKGVALLCQKE